MFRIRRRYGLGLIALLITLWASGHSLDRLILAQDGATATPNVNWVSVPEGVNVRSGPGFNYDINGVLPTGAWVQPLARNIAGDWILITYLYTQGWVQIDGISWRLNTAALPVIDIPSPTPIARPLYYNTPGGPTYTPNANWVNTGAGAAYVRSGPGQGYTAVGIVLAGDVVDPVAHDQALDWVLIRYGDGYGWIRYDLVTWVDNIAQLPVVDQPNLTPSFTPVPVIPTSTPTPSPTITNTASLTMTREPSATWTPSPEPSLTYTPSSTFTATPSLTLTATASFTPTETPSLTPTATETASLTPSTTPTPQPTATETFTPQPTATASPEPSATPLPTAAEALAVPATWTPLPSPTPTETPSPVPTLTPTPSATATYTATPLPTETFTASPTATAVPTETLTASPSPTASNTPTATPTTTASPQSTATPQAVAIGNQANSGNPPGPEPAGGGNTVKTPPPSSTGSKKLPVASLLLGGGLILAALAYISVYVVQAANIARYQEGFMLSICPVCRGNLHIEDRRYRMLGIPRVRRVVRCDTCRSVLRQVGRQRWRYAVDGAENPDLYDQLNGRVLTEQQLIEIAPEYHGEPPEFIEGDDAS